MISARLSTHLELGTGAAEHLVYLLHENQNGFRWNRSCEEHVFTLQQAIENNKGAVGVFVDIRKAYPTVFREGLFLKLAQKGITGKTWRVLRDMYDGLTSQVKVAGQLATDEGSDGNAAGVYEVETGLMEGASNLRSSPIYGVHRWIGTSAGRNRARVPGEWQMGRGLVLCGRSLFVGIE